MCFKVTEVICRQSLWCQVLHVSQAIDFPQHTALEHSPHGYFGVLGPGLHSTWPLRRSPSRMWYRLRFVVNLRPFRECQ